MVNPAARFEVFKLKHLATIVDRFQVMDNFGRNRSSLSAASNAEPTISPLRRSRRAPPARTLIKMIQCGSVQNGVLERVRAGVLPALDHAPAARAKALATSSLDSLFLVLLMSRTLP